jgi:hypothetical protein
LVDLIHKKKENMEKGNHEFMRRNKRNTNSSSQEPTFEMKIKKYSIYKNGRSEKGNYTSVGKLDKKTKLDPILKTATQNMHVKTEDALK